MGIAVTAPFSPEPGLWAALDPCGDEAMLPGGTCLVGSGRPARQCFRILDGAAAVEAADGSVTHLAAGSFVGTMDAHGTPQPLADVVVRLTTASRVLVFEVQRLAALLEADTRASAAWRAVMLAPQAPR
jgi:hypothetical protein